MGKTIAEALMEEGEAPGVLKGTLDSKRQTLLRLVRLKFKRVSPAITAEIEAAQEVQQLDEWLDAFATAEKIADIAFPPGRRSFAVSSSDQSSGARRRRVSQEYA